MKKTSLVSIVTLAILTSVASSAALAAPKKKASSAHTETATSTSTQSDRESSGSTMPNNFGLGYSSIGGGTVSGWLQLNEKDSLQFLFGIGSTSPFTFTAGPVYRHTMHGSRDQGFHLGGGLLLGTVAAVGGSAFSINILPMAGIHFKLPHVDPILFSLDGGMNFAITDGSFGFSTGAASNLLGLSAQYFF